MSDPRERTDLIRVCGERGWTDQLGTSHTLV